MPKKYVVPIGKAVRSAMRLRGGGSALPGLVVEKIDPDFVRRTLEPLKHGVVVISGTNGKTTTTKMVVELLESQGLKVFTNRTGSNFSRGVAAALLGDIDIKGELDADIAVLELDEAHGARFVETIKPTYALLLNVMRDQLDRFGEVDTTAKLLSVIAKNTEKGVVLNRDDPHLCSTEFLSMLNGVVRTFGADSKLQSTLRPGESSADPRKSKSRAILSQYDDVCLEEAKESSGRLFYDGKRVNVNFKINGAYNFLNAAAAVAMVRLIMDKEIDESSMLAQLEAIEPAFGRGETFSVHDQTLKLILVKNPSGFRLSLDSFQPKNHKTMIAINDSYADGRDMSWLWDVDFNSLNRGVEMVSGVRAFDMALRLQYDEVPISHVEANLKKALEQFILDNPDNPKYIFSSYTAMLEIRKILAKSTEVEKIS